MGFRFPDNTYAKYTAATFMDNVSQMSVVCRFKFTSIVASENQFLFRHRLGTSGDQFSLRKDSVANKLKASITRNGVVTLSESGAALVADTTYFGGMAWKVGDASGQVLFLDGSAVDTDSTSGQSGNYNTLGGDLAVAARWKNAPADILERGHGGCDYRRLVC